MPRQRTANLRPIPILMYHQIEAAPPRGASFRSLYVAPAAFARQMFLLNSLGYRGLSMSALMPYLKGECSGKVVGITFDDGYLNNLVNALPVLKRHGFSSTCYVVSQYVGKTNVWDHEVGIPPASLMDAQQLRQWLSGGQEVGAHTRHHVHLMQANAPTCNGEIAQCKLELENMTGSAVRHFCYPYGEYTANHVAIAREVGFQSVTSTRRGRCHADQDLLQLPRVTIVRSTTLPLFWLKLATRYEDRRRL